MSASLIPGATSLLESLEAEQAADDHPRQSRRGRTAPSASNGRVLTYAQHKDAKDARDNPNKAELAAWLKAEAKRALAQRPLMRRWRREEP